MKLHTLTHIATFILFTSCIIQPTQISAATKPLNKTYQTFIKTSCNTTTYPSLCYKTLLPYATSVKTNYLKLSSAALTVTISAAQNTSTLVSELSRKDSLTKNEASAIRDCIENIRESVYELRQTLKAVGNLKGSDRAFQLSNAKTWASAAITDEDTCMDGFSDTKVSSSVKKQVKKSILAVTKLNSNALSLINHIY